MGLALAALEKYEDAIKEYNECANIDKTYYCAHNNWGLALAALEKYEDAIEKYNDAINIESNAEAYYRWGNVLFNQKKYLEAIEKYDDAIKIDHNYAQAYHNIANIFWKLGMYNLARRNWEKARDSYYQKAENRADLYQYLGNVLHFLKDSDTAEKIYKKGLSLDQDHIGILIGLVYLYIEKKDLYIEKRDTDFDENIQYNLEKYTRRVECLLKNELKKKEKAITHLKLGKLYLALEEYEQSEKNLLSALYRCIKL